MKVQRLSAVALAVVLAAVVLGCGSSSGGGKGFRVAFLLPGAVTDQGYNADGQRTANNIQKKLGAQVKVVQSVAVPNQTDVYRQFGSQGYNLVIGWGGQFSNGAVTAAKEFPKTTFLVVNSNVKNGTNLASMDTKVEQWQFFSGYVLAKLSKSGTVGYVGGQCFPSTAADVHGTEQGAKFANPHIKFLARFVGDFEDPTKAQQAADAFIGQGADAVTGDQNNGWAGIYNAAQQNGNVPIITEWVDNHQAAPKVIASSVLKSQVRFVTDLAARAKKGQLKSKFYLFGLPKNWGPVMSKTDLLPAKVYDEAISLQPRVTNGQIKVKRDESCAGF
jgi:basic membrane protein A and related proteins